MYILIRVVAIGAGSDSTNNERPQRPPHSYVALVSIAIERTQSKRTTLAQICQIIRNRFAYYRENCKQGWENSIRYNLSLNECFQKLPRAQSKPGKGHYWIIDPMASARHSHFRPRKRYKKGNAPEPPNEDGIIVICECCAYFDTCIDFFRFHQPS